MDGILAAIISTLSFSIMNVARKHARDNGASTLGVLAVLGFAVPLWLIIGFFVMQIYSLIWSNEYAFITLAWVVAVLALAFFYTYIMKFLPITELIAYILGLSVIIAFISDYAVFSIEPGPNDFIAMILFFAAALILKQYSSRKIFADKPHPYRTLLLLLVISIGNVFIINLYKIGLSMQEHLLVHMVIAQSLLHGTFFLIGFRYLKKDLKMKKISMQLCVILTASLIFGVLGEAYSVAALPVAVLVMVGSISIALYYFADVWKKHLHLKWQTTAAAMLMVIGLILIG